MSKYDKDGFATSDGGTFDIGDAMTQLKVGEKVARRGWNGKGMYLILRPQDINSGRLPQADLINAQGKRVAWNASQEDLFADDWGIANE